MEDEPSVLDPETPLTPEVKFRLLKMGEILAAFNGGLEEAATLCEKAIRPELSNFNDIEKGWNEALTAAAGAIRKQTK